MTSLIRPARASFEALGTTAEVLVDCPELVDAAATTLREWLFEVDLACSRFREDSEISRLHRMPGRTVRVSRVLAGAIEVALWAAQATDGLVDPTVGQAVSALGYDRDFAALEPDAPSAAGAPVPAAGWWRVGFEADKGLVCLPRGVVLDLGATAKAWAADRAAQRIHADLGCSVLVSLGGDIAVAGRAPDEGWAVSVGEDHRGAHQDADSVVSIREGGLATSSTTCRRWRRAGLTHHHIVDPRTGASAEPVWRAVSVAAATCADANAAATAAVVLGAAAPQWLAARGLPARLVGADSIVRTQGWPADAGPVGIEFEVGEA
jgi:thiamine biosynthesis lipoprotein